MSKTKLAVLDFDSTLIEEETLDVIYDNFIKNEENYAELKRDFENATLESMKTDKVDFNVSLKTRARLLKGMSIDDVNNICKTKLNYTTGAKALVEKLKTLDYIVVIFSGGFRNATSLAKEDLGVDQDYSNEFVVDSNGKLTGDVYGPMTYSSSKGELIQKLQKAHRVSKENTLVVGDGSNDISMFEHAETSIAFCAKDVVKRNAKYILDIPNLYLITEFIS